MNLDNDKKYKCVICQNLFKGYHNLLKHFKKSHPQYELRNYKRKADEDFTFEEGSHAAIGNKKIKADFLVDALHLVPAKLEITHDTITYNFFDLASKSTMVALKGLGLLNEKITCSITGHTDKKMVTIPAMSAVDISQLAFPSFPDFYTKMGEYVHISDALQKQLNSDSCEMAKVSQLFVGSLIVVENITLFVLTVEIYARDFFVDAHAENHSISFPEQIDIGGRYYNSIKIALSTVGQGKQLMKKLVIGSTTFNILVTSSMLLSPREVGFVTCGPTCHKTLHHLDLNYTQILLRQKQVNEFENGEMIIGTNISNCRQLMSAFDHESTYFSYRASLLQNPNIQPLTVFTIGGVPANEYGMSIHNKARAVSHFFKTVASWVLKAHVITLSDIRNLKSLVKGNKEITVLVIALEKEYQDNNNVIDILVFLRNQKGLSAMAQSLSQNISTANDKVKQEIMSYFSNMFGKR
ncbi:hypothetical protein RMATCC62417_12650 [Rhizopus microsporus]|nr:hypothetical protein RMATCC62417_12650 [Rhizopus microsporus]